MEGKTGGWGRRIDFNQPLECLFCSSSSAQLTVRHLLSTSNWEFFYCFNCRNWFKSSERDQSEMYLVKERKLVTALEFFTQASEMFQPGKKRKKDHIRSFIKRITFAIFNFLSPYLSDN